MNSQAHIQIIDPDRYDIPVPSELELPSFTPYILLDEDEGQCRLVSWDEMEPNYIDNNIEEFQVRPDPFAFYQIDEEQGTLIVQDGREFPMQLSEIAENGDEYQYAKVAGLIWPIDRNGARLLNPSTTPNLVAFKQRIHEIVEELSRQQLELAEMVYSFTRCMTGSLGDVVNEMRRRESGGSFGEEF
jgi:hypothetical protein